MPNFNKTKELMEYYLSINDIDKNKLYIKSLLDSDNSIVKNYIIKSLREIIEEKFPEYKDYFLMLKCFK